MQTNLSHTFRTRIKEELRRLSATKSELYTLAFMNDDQPLNNRDLHLAEQCVKSMNTSLNELVRLYQYGREKNLGNDSQDTRLHMKFARNYIKGYYDKNHTDLCSFTKNKINCGSSR